MKPDWMPARDGGSIIFRTRRQCYSYPYDVEEKSPFGSFLWAARSISIVLGKDNVTS